MSIRSEVTRILNAKTDIRDALIAKGCPVYYNDTIDDYANYINGIDNDGGYNQLDNPLTFYCDEAGTIGWKCSSSSDAKTIQYSKNFGETWTNLCSTTSGEIIYVSAGDIVWFKGSNAIYEGNNFTLSNKAHVYGNVNSLTGNNTSVSSYCFERLFNNCSKLYTYEHKKIILPATTLARSCYSEMFSGCTSLTVAPELPATTMVKSCYNSMFYGCTSLTTAPELPATTMQEKCYQYMFNGCTSLTTAPVLPATTLAADCYTYMFNGCTSLTVAPELPATTLASNCYSAIFRGCTSLTSAPELPATTLVDYCYQKMFMNCASLTTAPELPATTLASYCYTQMFQGCTSLNYIKVFFTTTPSSSYTKSWVLSVASWGVFVKSTDATWDVVGHSGVPTGWTVVKPPLYLPGEFSVSSTKKVKFSKGNLQAVIGTSISDYRATASSWNFAGHQYDFIGNAAGNTSFAVNTTVDLFGWVGASASYDSYGLCTSTSTNNAYYGTSASDALKTDWGSIPGVVSYCGSGWRTLTSTEWNYLFTQRANASSLYGHCQITTASGTVNGILILPDNWTKPSNCTVTSGNGAFDRVTYSATASSGTSNAWCDMEAAGAVFLPTAGYRYYTGVYSVGLFGNYWTSSVIDENYAHIVVFLNNTLVPQEYSDRYNGNSVRLIKDAN